ncbi:MULTISPECIES: type I-C CRISPR-associated protein Cas5c [Actinoalloteichus]|uniref:pre-crRNA processing endonuclease n=1 Tax=Actinoalloteichus fjordicus TaxID=1612552 RepID=A0AAC9PS62_9PSEU|nr:MULTISPECIES: type I-C CRISPR-associated protein Cas5c [Actinoalloteichus]APU14813.1 CRISPR-associated protein Cas5 [Actinoalloteichus fjordicus]APU20782.1 CRISPR-associated protein Cas5 [Actinoalloteichus sp. GBA129-24]
MREELSPSASGEPPVSVQVWGPGALFTRPELKAERVSYPVMTPTAAIGVLEAIFWKPEFRWRPVAIDVLNPIRQFTQRRNETTDLVSPSDALLRRRTVDTAENRTQRHAVCLRDVAYRIHAHVELEPHATKNEAAYRDQFRRRVERGQCFHQPYLGTREFSAYFGKIDERERITGHSDLGVMLHSVRRRGEDVAFSWFTARLENGRMHIPRTGITAAQPVGA